MAYQASELNLAVSLPGGAGGQIWLYKNGDGDTAVTMRGTDFFAAAQDKGMTVDDVILTQDDSNVGLQLMANAVDADGNFTAT
jgi:hypothetical protein